MRRLARAVALIAFAVTVHGRMAAQTCTGDCDGDGVVRINEILTGVNILLGTAPIDACQAFVCPGGLSITCAVESVANALLACRMPTATPTAASTCTVSVTRTSTHTPSVTPTPTPTRTCQGAPPPAACPPGEVIVCADQLCSIDCGCGTVTATPTPTNTCTPGANPPPGCAYEGSTRTHTITPCNEDRSTPTPTSMPTPQTSYELTDQSRLRLTDGTEEPATGRVVVFSCYSPNTYYAYEIESVAIASDSVVISSRAGRGTLEAVTIYPEEQAVGFTAPVLINGVSALLTGFGPLDKSLSGETLDLELSAGPFTLHMEAVRSGPPYMSPLPSEWCLSP